MKVHRIIHRQIQKKERMKSNHIEQVNLLKGKKNLFLKHTKYINDLYILIFF